MDVFLLALLAAAGFGLATLLVEGTLGTSRTFHHYSVVVAAGILLGVALADLIPEAIELTGSRDAALAIAAGFIALYLVESLTRGHTHHHEPHAEHIEVAAEGRASHTDHAHAHGHGNDPACVPTHAVLPFLIGLSFHNLADGVIIGTSHEVSTAAAASVAVGIVVHQLPVGLSFAAVLLASGLSRGRMRRNALLVAAMIPLGAGVVLAAPALADASLGILVGIAAGALLYIATGHLLPEAHSEERRPGIAAAFTAALVGTVLFVGALHDTAHADAPAHVDQTGQDDAHGDEHEDEHAGE